LKFQITNPKKQINNNDRNSKSQTIALNRFGIWNLRFICNLVLGICDLRHKTPRQNHLSLTWPKGPGFSGQNKIMVTLASGVDIDTSGGLRILELLEKYYVVGQDLLISTNSREEAREEIRKLKGLEC
jgi:hypothetical protein